MNNAGNTSDKKESASLRFMYSMAFGRLLLKVASSRTVSKICGAFLDSPLSKPMIKRFVKENGIDLGEYYSDGFRCFNDCFSRKIKDGLRPIDEDENSLVSPCDGLISAYRLTNDEIIPVKQSRYSLSSLLDDRELAKWFSDGICIVFRLCVNHYHRYCYPASGRKSENRFIKGKLHTVRPIALEKIPVFTQNCREYTIIDSDRFGKIVQMEVGAMLVGKIKNFEGAGKIKKGGEKGMFLYGGSSIVLLLEKDAALFDEKLFENTRQGIETPVKMGQKIAEAKIQ